MKDPQLKRLRFVGLRFTQEEFARLEEKSKQSTTPQLSEFIRKCIFDKPITIKQRNQSLDDCMVGLMELKKELNAIGHNFNQSVRLLNTFKEVKSVEAFMRMYELDRQQLLQNVHRIEEHVHQIADQWLQ